MRKNSSTRYLWSLALLSPWLCQCSDDATTDDAARSALSSFPATDPMPSCDPLQPSWCGLPWPSNKFLVEDAARETGYALRLGPQTLPANVQGKHISPTEHARLDGYGPGTTLLVHFPNLDMSKMATEEDLSASLTENAQVVLLKVDHDGAVTRVPHWVETDLNAHDPQKTVTFIRPAVILEENMRYVIGLRGLKTKDGKPISPSDAFRELRDHQTRGGFLEARQARFDEVFSLLAKAGVAREELVLAWDFVTASSQSLHGDLLRIRDEAFKTVGEQGPTLQITNIKDHSKDPKQRWAYQIRGTFTVPRYTKDYKVKNQTSAVLHRAADGTPIPNGEITRDFWIRVPHTATDGTPHGIAQYGHGLLGRGSQVDGAHNAYLAEKGKLIFFACDWSGMAEADYQAIAQMVFDMSDFHILVDGLHQGLVEALLLGRSMRERFDKHDKIKKLGLKVDKTRFYFTGISQGGIYGGAYMALTQDVTRGHLGVPGQNYSILLHRSVDFAPFFTVMIAAYGESIDRALLLTAGQNLWDKVDPSSHYRHIIEVPYANTPKHDVLLASTTGDYQVALVTNEITVRSALGVKLMKHYGKAVWGVSETAFPHKGSGLVNWSFGNPWPAPGNLPPSDDIEGVKCGPGSMCLRKKDCASGPAKEACKLGDPHGKPRKLANHSEQMLHFFDKGEIKDVCADSHCDPF